MMNQANHWNYESAVAEVETIIKQIESGTLPLEGLFQQLEVATEKLNQCETFLTERQAHASLLLETLDQDMDF